MPIYEYRCSECGQDHEVLQKVSEPPLTECPACGKPALQKQLSAAGFHLKGSGWYATDFKGSGKKPAEKKAEATTEAKTEVKAETKSETKSAETKTESKPASTSTTTD
jgi:putative FmdB family regulatory protein